MLVRSQRHTIEDIAAWRRFEDQARVHAQLSTYRKHVERARSAILSFTGAGACYAGTSWGKDSTALAHLIVSLVPRVPVVWVHRVPYDNPDCDAVRDAFLAHHRCAYHEEIVECERSGGIYGGWRVRGRDALGLDSRPKQVGFALVAARFGARYLSGVRGDESAVRAKRARKGETYGISCAPLAGWSGWDVFAYLVTHGLPIHPAYACTMGGQLDPTRLRVGALGGPDGIGHGRAEWEARYYRDEVAALHKINHA